MSGAIPPLPLYAFVAVKAQGQLYLTLPSTSVSTFRFFDKNLMCISYVTPASFSTVRNWCRGSALRSEEFETSRGLRQGCILSPVLFNIVMDEVMKESKHKVKQFQVGYWKLQKSKYQNKLRC
jgi:hypothetical protein